MKKIATLLVLMVLGTFTLIAQDDRAKFGATEEEQIKCLEALQIYKTFRDQDGMEDKVYGAWQIANTECPCTAGERMLSDGVKFIKNEMKTADADQKIILKDSLHIVYNEWIECYPDSKNYKEGKNSCYVTTKMVADLLDFEPKNTEELVLQYEDAMICLGDDAPSHVISGFYIEEFKLLKKFIDEADKGKADAMKEKMILQYLDFARILKNEVDNAKSDKAGARAEKAQSNLDEIFKLIADCDQMIPILERNVEADPENLELKKKYLELMNAKKCDDSAFYLTIAEAVCEVEPNCDCLFSIGVAYQKSNPSKAMDYLTQATEMCPDGELGIKYNLAAAQIAYNIGSFSKATKFANRVLALDPNNAEAYFVKGDVAQNMANSCDDGNLGRYCAYWMSADYYARAKAVDGSVTSRANTKIANVSVAFPTTEKIFQAGVAEGSTFECPCFGTTTKVRVK